MPSGLIQLVTYGASDIFLTGNPQITFFRVVYRRHTNFAIENVSQVFQGETIDFGKKVSAKIEKVGDLIHRFYVAIDLPAVSLTNQLTIDEINQRSAAALLNYQTALTNQAIVNSFITANMQSYRSGILNTSSCPDNPTILVERVCATWDTCDPTNMIRDQFQNLLNTQSQIQFPDPNNPSCLLPLFRCVITYSDVYFVDVINNIQALILLGQTPNIKQILDMAIDDNVSIQRLYIDRTNLALQEYLALASLTAKFAWIRKLGNFIIEQIEIVIGQYVIDRQFGRWFYIWNELARNYNQDDSYAKMIGDVPELYTFDNVQKPTYKLIVPIPFWFARHNGLALPLIAMGYNDVHINIRFSELSQCAYVNSDGSLDPNLIQLVDAQLWIDYIYLDSDERKRFAQSGQEYLIEQVQIMTIPIDSLASIEIQLNFTQPCKELIWAFQLDEFITNDNEQTESQFYNFSLIRYNPDRINHLPQKIKPILESQINFSGQDLLPAHTQANYFNYVQPYECYNNTPAPGINVDSFGLNPIPHQPSGTANLGKIDLATLSLLFDPSILANSLTGTVYIFSRNYNVLRFIGGYCAPAFISSI